MAEPYSDFSARQTVLRVLELITPAGSTTHHTSNPLGLIPGATIFEAVRDGQTAIAGETMYEEVEVSLPSGKKGKQGKKEVVKVKRELASAENPFSDWKTTEWVSAPTSQLPLSQPPLEAQSCVKSIQVSPFNPPPPHLKQQGHQLYLTVSILEGDVYTLVCASRGWYVSKSNVNVFDPTPRSDGFTHSLVDLLHSISPLFSERLALLAPLSQEAPKSEPIATVPVPQYEPAYSFLAPTPKSVPAEPLRSQMAYLHTGATTADALDAARDWNEELQNVRELPRDSMQERVLREKMAQKTWAEFNAASIRVIMAIAVSLHLNTLM
jgi:protein TIF31